MESLDWLREKGLSRQAKLAAPRLRKVFKECFGARISENILIVGDKGKPGHQCAAILAGAFYFASQELGYRARFFLQDEVRRGEDASDNVISQLLLATPRSILIFCVSNKAVTFFNEFFPFFTFGSHSFIHSVR